MSRFPGPLRGRRTATILLALALAHAAVAAAQEGDLFKAVQGPTVRPAVSGTLDAAMLRRRVVTLDATRLARANAAVRGAGGQVSTALLRLNLFDDVVVTGVVDRTAPTFSGGYALSGRVYETASLDAPPLGTVTLVVNGSTIVGSVRTSRGTYRLRPAGGDRLAVIEIDPSASPSSGPPTRPAPPVGRPPFTPPDGGKSSPSAIAGERVAGLDPRGASTGSGQDADLVAADRAVLVEFYEATGGDAWTTRTNWLSDASLGEWHGVAVNGAGRVEGLDLTRNGLAGRLPEALAELDELRWLRLPINGLMGPIPPEIGKLADLQALDFDWNDLTGPIPPELGKLANLRSLSLGWNALTGPLPRELGSLTELRWLLVSRNGLTSSIPRELGRLVNLEFLAINGNALTGPLPRALGSLTELRSLYAMNNAFTGSIPRELANLANLETLDVSDNLLTGMLPMGFHSLPELATVDIGFTDVCAPPDDDLQAWLATIDFNGGICGPDDEFSIIDLAVVYTPLARRDAGSTEAIEAVIDLTVAETNLAYLDGGVQQRLRVVAREEVSYSETGTTSTDLGRLADPTDGYMDGVHTMRDSLGADLVHLVVGKGDFCIANMKGAFSICGRGAVRGFAHELGHNMGLSHDRFVECTESVRPCLETFPFSFGYVNQRMFEEGAPESSRWLTIMAYWDQCTEAGVPCYSSVLRFSNADQTWMGDLLGVPGDAPTPGVAGPADAVRALNLARRTVANFRTAPSGTQTDIDRTALEVLYEATGGAQWATQTNWLSDAPLRDWYGVTTDEAGRVRTLALGGNRLDGPLPSEIGTLSGLEILDLGHNAVSGRLPRAVWTLTNLRELHLQSNALKGPLGREVATLRSLRELNLGGNTMTGGLPSELGTLENLRRLDLSSTGLTGPLPGSLTQLRLDRLRIVGSGLCVPGDAAFQGWLRLITEFVGETCPPTAGGSVALDRTALEAIYQAADGDNWNDNTNWLSTKPIGEWEGVTTDADGRVTELRLWWNRLKGTLAPEIGDLSHLRVLQLGGNPELSGVLWPEVGNLTRLEALFLYHTGLKGPLPASVGRLLGLRRLQVSRSRLRGPLPQQLTKLLGLQFLESSKTGLCAPANDVFQTWLAAVQNQEGVRACVSAALTVVPETLTVPRSGSQTITLSQASGAEPAAWTATGTEAWLRVTPAAGLGGGTIDVSLDSAGLQPESGGGLTGAVVVSWDGVNARVPVTVPSGAVAAVASRRRPLPAVPRKVVDEDGRLGADGPGAWRAGRDVRGARGRVSARGSHARSSDWLSARMDSGGREPVLREPVRAGREAASSASAEAAGDRAALIALYNATDGENWCWNRHWLSDKPLGEWWGVATDDSGRVTRLSLWRCGLDGRIPPELGDLASLEGLNLGGNRLAGPIPPEFGDLTNLASLDLSENVLSGTIPPELGRLTRLWELDLNGNALTGGIPPKLGEVARLQYLDLDGNGLRGAIPPELGALTGLRGLHLGNNALTGRVPAELGNLVSLRRLHVQNNFLSGPIPGELGQLTNLEEADLGNNRLTGAIPGDLGGLARLGVLDLSNNELTGPIPDELAALAGLWWLDLRDNELGGAIPHYVGDLSELIWLDLAGNALEGSIPDGLGTLPHLRMLSLWRNRLTGSIPVTLAELPVLERLVAGDNELTGSIPAGTWGMLKWVSLPNNGFTGRLPASLAAVPSLEVLDVANSTLTGLLPQSWGAAALEWLDVAGNELTGRLPPAVGDLFNLRTLSLGGNRFTGALPGGMTKMYRLDHLWMGDTGLCAPGAGAFQTWLSGLAQFDGVVCGASGAAPATITAVAGPRRESAGVAGTRGREWTPPGGGGRGFPPVGQTDTPLQGATGVRGTIGMTGWVLDDGAAPQVTVYRDCLSFDDPSWCESVGGDWLLRLGAAAIVPGARPDVEAAYPELPPAEVAGWGYVLSTQQLPDVAARSGAGGEGPLALYAVATDADGHSVRLGRTPADDEPTRITLANRSLERPFGVIEAPSAGGTVRGATPTVGWVLTPDGDIADGGTDEVRMPFDGSTIVVWVDGQAWGSVAYDQCRGPVGNPAPVGAYCDDDVANTFGTPRPRAPGTPRAVNATRFRNLDAGRGAIGLARIDTTVLPDGAHTLSWSATDNAGRTSHLGTRYIIVANGSRAAGGLSRAAGGLSRAARDVTPDNNDGVVRGRQGWDPWAAWEPVEPDGRGERRVTLPVLGRMALRLGGPVAVGHLVGPGGPRSLPPGSRLDGGAGTFTWAVGPGYLGAYALRFMRPDGELVRVTVTVAPAAALEAGGVEGAIDAAASGSGAVRGSFTLSGWALDASAWQGAGIEAVQVWAQRLDVPAAASVFVGNATLGTPRPAAAAAFGAQFERAGWQVEVPDLAPGVYGLTAYFKATQTGRFEAARTVRATVR